MKTGNNIHAAEEGEKKTESAHRMAWDTSLKHFIKLCNERALAVMRQIEKLYSILFSLELFFFCLVILCIGFEHFNISWSNYMWED